MKTTPPEIASLQSSRARGLAELRDRVGDVVREIESRLASQEKLRVLEVGFGFGAALVELLKLYPERIELHGINRNRAHGDWRAIRRNALSLGLIDENEPPIRDRMQLHYCDVSEGLPFESDSIDVAFSQVAFIYFDNKIRFLEEMHRVLAPGGVARLDLWIEREDFPAEYRDSLEIWDEGRKISFWDHIKRFPNLVSGRGKKRLYLEMRKGEPLRFGLDLVAVIDMNALHKEWWGKKSVYRVRHD